MTSQHATESVPARMLVLSTLLTALFIVGCPPIELPQITPGNRIPTADAGPAASASVGDTVTLNASGSTDPDGDSLTYQWTQVGGPSVQITGRNQVEAVFEPSQVGNYEFTVTASDGRGGSDADTVRIAVGEIAPPPADAITVKVINSTGVNVEPEIYITGLDLDEGSDSLFTLGQALEFGTISGGGQTLTRQIPCSDIRLIGTKGGTFDGDANNSLDHSSALIVKVDISFACGDTVTFRFEERLDGYYNLLLVSP